MITEYDQITKRTSIKYTGDPDWKFTGNSADFYSEEMTCPFCDGAGCRMCEWYGSRMVDPREWKMVTRYDDTPKDTWEAYFNVCEKYSEEE